MSLTEALMDLTGAPSEYLYLNGLGSGKANEFIDVGALRVLTLLCEGAVVWVL
jgi:hypothetical protein